MTLKDFLEKLDFKKLLWIGNTAVYSFGIKLMDYEVK